jgi:hypothetical protein
VATDDPQSGREAQASSQELRGEERLEDPVPGLGVHAHAGVGHVNAYVLSGDDREPFRPGPFPFLSEVLGAHPDRESARLIADRLSSIDDQVHH